MSTRGILPIATAVALTVVFANLGLGTTAYAQQIVHEAQDSSAAQAAAQQPQQPTPSTPPSSAAIADYVLGVGDKLKITVFGEPDLSGNFEISSVGVISMPLIGETPAAQRTISQIQADITRKLASGYMRNPHVSLEVLNYRPFFIIGEVMKPGSYNYVNGMTVINAIALAGGYTYRADKDGTTVKHASGAQAAKEQPATEYTTVLPGDVINVPERFF